MNNPRSSRGREGERSEASRHRATWGYRWSVSKDLGEVSRGRRHADSGVGWKGVRWYHRRCRSVWRGMQGVF